MRNLSVSKLNPGLWSGLLLVIVGAVLLSAKGILSKLLYAEGLDFQEVITVRAILSLPLFWLWGIYVLGFQKIISADRKAMMVALAAGAFCYFIGGSLDFYALTIIDASLERVLLYVYPAIIVMILALRRRRWPKLRVLVALLMTYLGVVLAIGGFDKNLLQNNLFGALLVLLTALTYAMYFFANDMVGKRVGSIVFTIFAMTAATICLCIHFSLGHSFYDVSLSPKAGALFLILVLFVTVIPLFMLAEGIKLIGAQRAALLSTVGPASTIILAVLILGEKMAWFQYFGVMSILAGIIVLEWQQKQPLTISD